MKELWDNSSMLTYASEAFDNTSSQEYPTSFFRDVSAEDDLQRKLETCQREIKSLKKKLEVLEKHDTRPILQRVFSDGDVSIRVRHGRRPAFNVAFEKELYSVRWRGIELGCSPYRDGLLEEVNQTLVFLWCAYAKASSSDMTRSALKIRRLMLDFFEEI